MKRGDCLVVAVAKGTSTGTGAAQTIAHGLSSTPSLVSVVPAATGVSVTNLYADDTNLYLTVTVDKSYSWSAMVF